MAATLLVRAACAVAFCCVLAPVAWAEGRDLSAKCEIAASRAAQAHDIPFSVMMAITLTETGRRRAGRSEPWPWTVNMEGKGVWFDDRDSALAYVFKHYKTGARSFDVGCFQINYKWHGQAFASIEDMFDPQANADYAARFLTQLYQETGDWSAAAGAYHSRTPKYAEAYRAKFDAHRAAQTSRPAPQVQTAAAKPPRSNGFPLLQQRGQSVRLGSLVPLQSNDRRLIPVAAGG